MVSRPPVQHITKDVLFKPFSNENVGLFNIMRATYIDDGNTHHFHDLSGKELEVRRCDTLNWSPIGFMFDQVNHPFFGDGWINLREIRTYCQVMDVAPEFFIVYVELFDNELKKTSLELETPEPPVDQQTWSYKTAACLLRGMYEWASVTEAPWANNSLIAQHCKRFFEVIQFPEDLIEEIRNLPDMHVYRYIKGDTDARSRPTSYPELSDQMKEWFWTKVLEYPPKLPHERI